MSIAPTPSSVSLSDALYEFSLANHMPDAELLDQFVRRFPQHADALVDFAIEIVMDVLAEHSNGIEADDVVEIGKVSPTVSRVLSRFHNCLYQAKKSAVEERPSSTADAQSVQKSNVTRIKNPFSDLSRAHFRNAAQNIEVNSTFMVKLRDRQIEFKTIPSSFHQQVANEIGMPIKDVIAYLAEPEAQSSVRQFYKADGKPKIGLKQTFREAVLSSGLDEDKQRYLLGLQ